jgi:hypothetical protein
LPDSNLGRAEFGEALNFRPLIVRPEVEVDPVLDDLVLVYRDEDEARQSISRWPNLELGRFLVHDHPVKGTLPPASEGDRVTRLHYRLFPLEAHGGTIRRRRSSYQHWNHCRIRHQPRSGLDRPAASFIRSQPAACTPCTYACRHANGTPGLGTVRERCEQGKCRHAWSTRSTLAAQHEIPASIGLALPRGTRAPATSAPITWHQFDPKTFDLGRADLDVGAGYRIGLYSAERSICDAFRLRHLEGSEQAVEALKRWLRRPGSQPSQLLALAAEMGPRATEPIRSALQILL